MSYFHPVKIENPVMSPSERKALDNILALVRSEFHHLRNSIGYSRKCPDFLSCLRYGIDAEVVRYAAESTSPTGGVFSTTRMARYLGCNRNTARKYLRIFAHLPWVQGRTHRPRPKSGEVHYG